MAVFSKIGVIAQIRLAARNKRTYLLEKRTIKGLKSELLISEALRRYEPTTTTTIPITFNPLGTSERAMKAKRVVKTGLKEPMGARREIGACLIAVKEAREAKTFKKPDMNALSQKTSSTLGIPPVERIIRNKKGATKIPATPPMTAGETSLKTRFQIEVAIEVQRAKKRARKNHIRL